MYPPSKYRDEIHPLSKYHNKIYQFFKNLIEVYPHSEIYQHLHELEGSNRECEIRQLFLKVYIEERKMY